MVGKGIAGLLTGLAVSGAASSVWAQPEAAVKTFFPAARLIASCANEADKSAISQCVGYLAGVADTENQRLQFTGKAYFCRRSEFTIGQLRDIVIAYARAHPEQADIGAANMVTLAWQGAFPCPPDKASP